MVLLSPPFLSPISLPWTAVPEQAPVWVVRPHPFSHQYSLPIWLRHILIFLFSQCVWKLTHAADPVCVCGRHTEGVGAAERRGLTAQNCSCGEISFPGLRHVTPHALGTEWLPSGYEMLAGSWHFRPASISGMWGHRIRKGTHLRCRLGCRGAWVSPSKCLLQESSSLASAFSAHTN